MKGILYDRGIWYPDSTIGRGVTCIAITCLGVVVLKGVILGVDMPVDVPNLLGLFYSSYLFC